MSMAKPKILKIWQDEWDHKKGSWHHNIKPKTANPGPTLRSVKDTKTLTRLRVGKSIALRTGKFIFKFSTSPNCPTCNKVEDMAHFLMECKQFRTERHILTETLFNLGLAFTAKNLLNPDKNNRTAVFKAVLFFVGATKPDI